EAVDAAREARALSESAWVWPYEESRLGLALAEVALAAGDHDAARDALRRGRDRLHERAAALPDPVLRRSFLERAHESVRLAALARDWLPGDAPPASPPPAS
ncbi:MAG TPA: hypothetical protein VG389_15415, partial [Myxococcota bacterium]|nr:hypothetical protein [Myxococcota bacterium]